MNIFKVDYDFFFRILFAWALLAAGDLTEKERAGRKRFCVYLMLGAAQDSHPHSPAHTIQRIMLQIFERVNDPSAGSPTETLLRLFLPLNDKVYLTSRAGHKD